MSSGQVLQSAYSFDKAKTVIREMADNVALDLVEQGLVAGQIVLTVGYDRESLTNPEIRSKYHGKITLDHYGRQVPYHAHGTANFKSYTSSSRLMIQLVTELYERIVDPILLIRRLTLSVNCILPESRIPQKPKVMQLDLFTDYEELRRRQRAEARDFARERKRQEAIISLRRQFGKNAILKGLNYGEGATQRDRNQQIGGHHQ